MKEICAAPFTGGPPMGAQTGGGSKHIFCNISKIVWPILTKFYTFMERWEPYLKSPQFGGLAPSGAVGGLKLILGPPKERLVNISSETVAAIGSNFCTVTAQCVSEGMKENGWNRYTTAPPRRGQISGGSKRGQNTRFSISRKPFDRFS